MSNLFYHDNQVSVCQATPGVTTWEEYGGGTMAEVAGKRAASAGSSIKLNPSIDASSPSSPSVPSPSSPGAYVQLWTCKSEVPAGTCVVGYGKLKNLLQPKHKYFEDKWAEIKHWNRYLDSKTGRDLVYPRVKTYHRENPFRRYQLNRQCSARSSKKLFQLIEDQQLSGMRIIDIETTMPGVVSKFLADKGKPGRDAAWNMNKRFWNDMIENDLIGEGHARRSNLHTWSSEEPVKPHFHFHELVPNFEQIGMKVDVVDMPKYPCSDCGKTLWVRGADGYFCATCNPVDNIPVLTRRDWKRNAKYTFVPWNEKDLIKIKALWLNILLDTVRQKVITGAWDKQDKLLRFQRRYGIKGLMRLISFLARFNKGLIDVYISYVKLSDSLGKAKLMNKLSYNGRHPIEDYAVYSNKYPDCEDPPAFIQHYDNKARVFGWWGNKKMFGQLPKDMEKVKLSPYTAEPMEYLGRYDTSDLFSFHEGNLVAVDIIRGSPVERPLNDDDIQWLHDVEYQAYISAF